jgi:formate dehydrogenase iron-sulfur subunit
MGGVAEKGKLMMIDTSKCIGCKACQVACQQWHSLEAEDTTFTGSYQNPPDMSGANLTVVKYTEIGDNGDLKWLFFKDQCRHCDPAPCKSGCLWGAIKRKPNGIVYIDLDLCNPEVCTSGRPYLDRPCELSCPYSVPHHKYMKNGVQQGLKAMKCDFCRDRFGNSDLKNPPYKGAFRRSNIPACELACPPGAIMSGNRNTILTKAKRRVRWLKNHGYPNANIYKGTRNAPPVHVIWVLTENKSAYELE